MLYSDEDQMRKNKANFFTSVFIKVYWNNLAELSSAERNKSPGVFLIKWWDNYPFTLFSFLFNSIPI